MIPVPSGVRVWLAVGRTDMRKGMNGLALQVQQALGRDPHAGDLYVFRGARGDLIKARFSEVCCAADDALWALRAAVWDGACTQLFPVQLTRERRDRADGMRLGGRSDRVD